MKVFSFSKKMMIRDFNKCLNYSLVVYASLIISFIFGDFIKNPLLLENDLVIGGATFIDMTIPLSMALPFIVLLLTWIMILYASNFYLNSQTDSFSLILLSGGSAIDVAKYVLWQVAIIFMFNLLIALLTGPFILTLIYKYMFSYLNIDIIYQIPFSTYLFVFYSLIPISMMICLLIAGFSYRNTLQVLLGRTKTDKNITVKRKDNISWIYIIIYLLSIWLVYIPEHTAVAYIFPCMVGVIGIYGLFKSAIPKFIKLWKNKSGTEKKCLYISLSNYSVSIQDSAIFIMLMFILICGIIPILISQAKFTNEYITGVISYAVIAIMIVVCIVYKFIDRIMKRLNEFNCLSRLGYIRKDFKLIILLEVIIYYITVIFVPLPLILIIGARYILNNDLTLLKYIILMAIFIVPIILSIFITYNLYKKNIIKKER